VKTAVFCSNTEQKSLQPSRDAAFSVFRILKNTPQTALNFLSWWKTLFFGGKLMADFLYYFYKNILYNIFAVSIFVDYFSTQISLLTPVRSYPTIGLRSPAERQKVMPRQRCEL
jgi:hypothetical protein